MHCLDKNYIGYGLGIDLCSPYGLIETTDCESVCAGHNNEIRIIPGPEERP